MEFNEVINKRKSVRKYTDQKIDKETIESIIESARLAPSAVNKQPWKFYICTSDKVKASICESYNREWFTKTQIYIVACGDHSQSWKRLSDNKDHCEIDIAIAVEHIVLKSTDLGLGTCWVCNFNTQIIRDALHLPEYIEPIVLLPIGYYEDDYEPDPRNKNRKDLNEIVEWI